MSPTTEIRHDTYDAILVGARCAGAATALLLARRGLRVLAVDRSAYASDTLSTHALMRTGVLQLQRFGLLDAVRATDTPQIHTTTFHYGRERVVVEIKPKAGVDALYSPRRQVLDALIVDGARDAGAEVRYGVGVRALTRRADGRVTGVVLGDESGALRTVEAGIVIGADGMKSQVARLTGARTEHGSQHTTAVVYAYFTGLRVSGYHFTYAAGSASGAIPTSGGATCVFVGVTPARYARELIYDTGPRFVSTLAESAPELAAALGSATRLGSFRRFAGRLGYVRQAFGPGFALVGDAGYFKDPCTAHGISDALRDAELLARAVAAGGSDAAMSRYQATRDALSLPFFVITNQIASFEWDLPQVQAMHVALSEEMARETRAMAALDAAKVEAA